MSIWWTWRHRKIQNTVSKKHSPHTTQQTASTQLKWVVIVCLCDHLSDWELGPQPLPSITGESQTPYYQPEKGSKSKIWNTISTKCISLLYHLYIKSKIHKSNHGKSETVCVPLKYPSCYPQEQSITHTRQCNSCTLKKLHVIKNVLITLVSVQKRCGRRDSSQLTAVVFHAWIFNNKVT